MIPLSRGHGQPTGGTVMRHVLRVCLALLVVGCGGAPPSEAPSQPATATRPIATTPVATATIPPSAEPTPTAAAFSTEVFAAITDDPVPADLAAELKSVLDHVAIDAGVSADIGVSATIMSSAGTWSGASGKASGARDVMVEDQFSIASITKSVTAAQVMQLVEAGELGLDDPVADHLPSDLEFDTNGATIRHLLGHRSGIPNYGDSVDLTADPLRFWTPAELLAAIPADRTTAGEAYAYGNTDYLLLGLAIEEVTGRPMAKVLRGGVLGIDGVERLIYQPDEVPTQPMAIENGQSIGYHEANGGFLPSLALTSDGPAAAMASDSVSLGRWWRALCAGEIVSEATLIEMTTMHDGDGLGVSDVELPEGTVGHAGTDPSGNAVAGCLPERGVVFAVMANRAWDVLDTRRVADALVRAIPAP